MDRLIRPALEGFPTALFCPTYKIAGDCWRGLKETMRLAIRESSEQDRRFVLCGGGSLEVWSLADNPDAGRGRSYRCCVIDEAAQIPNLQHAWEQSIRPMLADHRGDCWFLSSPRGVNNYFHGLYQRGQSVFAANWKSWRMATSTNPFISAEEVEDMKSDLSEMAYQQEILAAFVSWEGAVFRRIMDAIMTGPAQGKVIVVACDWAKASDFTVFVALTDRGEVAGIDRFRQVDYVQQHSRLRAFWQKHGCPPIWSERNAMGGAINDYLRADHLPVTDWDTNSASKQQMIGALQMAFESGAISIPNDAQLIAELQSFEGVPSPSGMMRYGAPAGLHDDMVIALAIAWAAVGETRRPPKFDPRFMAEIAQANRDLAGMSAVRAGAAGDFYGGADDLTFSGSADPWARKWAM
jgi:hypothetical protein